MHLPRNIRTVPFVASVAFALLVGLAWLQHQHIYDWWRLRQYQPPVAIAQLASETTMNDATRRLFYVHHPMLQGKVAFNESCSDSEKTIVLGCYVSRQGIYLYDVTDERLHGLEEVTAAHEVLHAAYERLSGGERKQVDAMTASAYAAVTDGRIRDTVEAYRKKDPSVVPNELHSILATEVADLPTALEDYYRQYFVDRKVIVKLSQQYQQEFTSRQERVAAADSRLTELKAQIEQLEGSLEGQQTRINAEYERMQNLKNSGQIEAYNARVTGYNRQVGSYNADVKRLQGMISSYNALVAERNALAVEENELLKAMDSRPTAIEAR